MGLVEKMDRRQQEVHDRTARDGIAVSPGAKWIVGLSLGSSLVIMAVIIVMLVARSVST